MEEKNNNQQEEDCPLCRTSEEAMEKLKSIGKANPEPEKDKGYEEKKAKSPQGLRMVFLGLLVIMGAFIVYQYLVSSMQEPVEKNNPDQAQAIAENQPDTTSESAGSSQPGYPASDFSVYDTAGNKIALSDFRGKRPVLLVFWATWCGFCAKELPDLKTFAQENKNKLKVLVVASGEGNDTVKEYIKEKGINFTILLDEDRKVWNLYGARGTPSHFLIDIDGKIVTARPGLASLLDLKVMLTML